MYKNEVYQFLANYIANHSGITYGERDYFRLENRVTQLIKHFNLQSADDLINLMQKNQDLRTREVIINLATNNETFFFRDLKQFQVLSKLLQSKQKAILWSAACSTGQEPYSMAMTLFDQNPFLDYQLFASDISTDALKKARDGIYSQHDLTRGMEVGNISRFFNQVEDSKWSVKPNIKSKIQFLHLNLFNDPFPQSTDIVFCRNVLIYQTEENKLKILKKIEQSMVSGGALFLGQGESLLGMDLGFKQEITDGAMFFLKK
jgi:chemotaxis protein methyltransferase CheR